MRGQIAGIVLLLGAGLLLGGCVYVPPGPYGPGYYAPAGAVVAAPGYAPGYAAPQPYYRPYYRPYYGY